MAQVALLAHSSTTFKTSALLHDADEQSCARDVAPRESLARARASLEQHASRVEVFEERAAFGTFFDDGVQNRQERQVRSTPREVGRHAGT